jgi:inhibitor of cysteine peptidase
MKMIKTSLFAFFAILVMLPFALSAKDVSLAYEDNGKTVALHTGDKLVVSLGGNITTGYSWNIVEPLPPMLHLLGACEYVPDQPIRAGSPGTFIFRFQADSTGSSNLNLAYARPWEKNVPPYSTFKVSVVVE